MSVIVIVFGKCLRHNSLEHQKVKYYFIYIPIHKSEFLLLIYDVCCTFLYRNLNTIISLFLSPLLIQIIHTQKYKSQSFQNTPRHILFLLFLLTRASAYAQYYIYIWVIIVYTKYRATPIFLIIFNCYSSIRQ